MSRDFALEFDLARRIIDENTLELPDIRISDSL